MPFSTMVAGLHVKCYINGVLLGLLTSVQWNTATDYRDAREIDSNIPKELIPGQNSVQGTFSVLRGRLSGGLEGAGLAATASDMLLQKLMTVELVDRVTDEVIFKAEKCQVLQQAWIIAPKQLVIGQFSWVGTLFSNETRK